MMILRPKGLLFLLGVIILTAGCVRFTQRDYELQEQAYQKERQAKELRDKETIQWRW